MPVHQRVAPSRQGCGRGVLERVSARSSIGAGAALRRGGSAGGDQVPLQRLRERRHHRRIQAGRVQPLLQDPKVKKRIRKASAFMRI